MPYTIRMPKTHNALWILQFALAAVFVLHGILTLNPPKELQDALMQMPLSPGTLHFIVAMEFLGAVGLVLPAVTRIAPVLTPMTAAALTLLMLGATGYHLWMGEWQRALIPAILALFCAFVAEGRTRFVRIPARPCPAGLEASGDGPLHFLCGEGTTPQDRPRRTA